MYKLHSRDAFTGNVILPPCHPYVLGFSVAVNKCGKKWRVVYRDFTSVKQDPEFNTKIEAIKFAERLKATVRYLDEYNSSFFEQSNDFWLDMASGIWRANK